MIRMTSQIHMRIASTHNYVYHLYSIFIRVLNVHTLNTHKNDTHWLTQWTRAHYCWQIFAFEATAFVYPLAVSTEAQFDQGWKRLRGEAQLTPSVQRPHLRSTTLVLKGGSLSLESYPFFHPAPGKTWRNIPLNHSLENWKNIVKMRTTRMFCFFSREAIGSSEYSAPMCVCFSLSLFVSRFSNSISNCRLWFSLLALTNFQPELSTTKVLYFIHFNYS